MRLEKNSNALTCALVFGALLALCGMGVRLWCGAPYAALTQMGIREIIPPVWLMSLLWTLWYFVLGALLGAILCAFGKNCINAWRGACFFLLMIGIGFLWYPLFFGKHSLVLSFLIVSVVLVLCCICALYWQTLSLVAGVVLWLHALWLIYMLILQLICLFGV